MKSLKQIEDKMRRIAVDLDEMDDGSDPKHQAKKLKKLADDLLKTSTQVHGSGTGED